jgi:hypothetical protein
LWGGPMGTKRRAVTCVEMPSEVWTDDPSTCQGVHIVRIAAKALYVVRCLCYLQSSWLNCPQDCLNDVLGVGIMM